MVSFGAASAEVGSAVSSRGAVFKPSTSSGFFKQGEFYQIIWQGSFKAFHSEQSRSCHFLFGIKLHDHVETEEGHNSHDQLESLERARAIFKAGWVNLDTELGSCGNDT